jgi:hypothetical protein
MITIETSEVFIPAGETVIKGYLRGQQVGHIEMIDISHPRFPGGYGESHQVKFQSKSRKALEELVSFVKKEYPNWSKKGVNGFPLIIK